MAPKVEGGRARVNHFHGRYWRAVQRAFSVWTRQNCSAYNVIMKFMDSRSFSDPEAAAQKLMEIANAVEPVRDGRIFIELIKGPLARWH
jgi:hypothetical protein